MKTCNQRKNGVHLNCHKEFLDLLISRRFRKTLFIAFLILVLTVSFVNKSFAKPGNKYGQTTKTIHIVMHILPNTELAVKDKDIKEESYSLEADKLKDILAINDKNVRVEKITRNGENAVLVTKILTEALY